MLIQIEISQRISTQNGGAIFPTIRVFEVKASSVLEAVRKSENSEEYKAIKNAFVSDAKICEQLSNIYIE